MFGLLWEWRLRVWVPVCHIAPFSGVVKMAFRRWHSADGIPRCAFRGAMMIASYLSAPVSVNSFHEKAGECQVCFLLPSWRSSLNSAVELGSSDSTLRRQMSRARICGTGLLHWGTIQKNYFRKTSPGRVEMRIRRKTRRVTPNRSLAWLRRKFAGPDASDLLLIATIPCTPIRTATKTSLICSQRAWR
jgi:hypothetical protein